MPHGNLAKLQACFEHLGVSVHTAIFDEKLVAQKLTDILQDMGIKLGYEGSFQYHVRGMYSRALTDDLYHATDSSTLVVAKPARLSQPDLEKLDRFKGIIDPRPSLLEVVSTYRHFRKQGSSQDDSVRLVKEKKPFLTERDVAIGVSKAKQLFPEFTPEVLADLEQDMAPWDSLAPH